MRLPGRLSAAIDVLADIDARKRPVSEALKAWGLNNRFAGAGDRAAIGNLVYDAVRHRASLAFLMGEDTPRALILAVAVREWGETVEGLNGAFAADTHAPEQISEAEAARLAADLADAPDHIRADMPEWVVPSLLASLGPDWVEEGIALAARPPLDLRINTLRSTRERVEKSLNRFEPHRTALAPDGLRIPAGTRDSRTPNVQTDEGYLKGWFEIQDQGSQIVAALAGAKPGEQVLDLCAGAGGKTLAMAAAMANKGQIFAYDSDRNRLAPIYDRLKRNGVRNAQVRAPEPGALDDLAGRLDRVVIDAPCTGTGTWRRQPHAKWKLTPDQVALRTGEQSALLAQGAGLVKVGGTLAYITCSVLHEENDGQIKAFLAAHPEFALISPADAWAAALPEATMPVWHSTHGVTITPRNAGTDGFYIAILKRTA